MSLLTPEYTLLHLLAFAIVGFIAGRISARAGDPRRSADKKQQQRTAARTAQQNLDRLSPRVRAEVETLLADGRIIEAVRDVRAALSLGLKEAKDVVDLLRQLPPTGGARLH